MDVYNWKWAACLEVMRSYIRVKPGISKENLQQGKWKKVIACEFLQVCESDCDGENISEDLWLKDCLF